MAYRTETRFVITDPDGDTLAVSSPKDEGNAEELPGIVAVLRCSRSTTIQLTAEDLDALVAHLSDLRADAEPGKGADA